MRARIFNLCLILTSLLGYLEWGQNQRSFLFEVELEVLTKMVRDPLSIAHPMVLLPLLGQVLLLITLFQKRPSKTLTYLGMACLGILLGLMFFIGLIEMHIKILGSTLPFLLTCFLIIRHYLMKKSR